MRLNSPAALTLVIALTAAQNAYGQKVKVGYDKEADFSKFKSYTWADPATPPQRPALYQSILGSIDSKLESKGLSRVQSNGDLVIVPAGGIGFGLNTAAGAPIMPTYSGPPPSVNATVWTGAGGPGGSMATAVGEGTLGLTFVDRANNKVVWSGTVADKLDPEKKDKSAQKIENCIVKLLKEFPPKK